MSLSQIAGRNTRALRQGAGVTLNDFTRAMHRNGASWSTGRVGDFESGRSAPNFETWLTVAAALRDVTGKPIELADLFVGTGAVKITDTLTVKLSTVRNILAGAPVTIRPASATLTLKTSRPRVVILPKALSDVDPRLYSRVEANFSEADVRMCKNVGVDPSTGAAAMAKLWGKTFTARRDELGGPDANAQRRGRISRQLKTQLQDVLR